ncbi:MAG: glutamate 5-kinase [Candidatus Lambdaproteobacteria bacterium]|nr:glutamate 5-kinase [Candidatus Lambdaproteobacteria bacterium]
MIKVGTNVLTRANQQLDYNVIHQIVEQIGALRRAKHRVVLVTSGAVGASYGLGDFAGERQELVRKQMASAVGQPRLMQIYTDFFREQNIAVAQALLTRGDFSDRKRYLNIRNVVDGLLEMAILPIINENDVVANDALTFGDNDYLSAAVASMIGADRLFLLTSAAGFFLGGDPAGRKSTRRVPEVQGITPEMWASCERTLTVGGTGGMLSKLKAAEMATGFGIRAYVASGKEPDVVPRILAGEPLGTMFHPTRKRPRSYRQWLHFATLTTGRILVDEGAHRALRNNKSLLPAGIAKVEGEFNQGDIVEIYNGQEEKLGVGLVNYSAQELQAIIKDKSARTRGEEAIHKDRLLLV